MLARARILRADQLVSVQSATPRDESGASSSQPQSQRARVLKRAQVQADQAARQIREQALNEAEEIKAAASLEASDAKRVAQTEGYATGVAEAVAKAIKLAQLEEDLDRRALERSVQMARLLAERLLGRECETNPKALSEMAKQVLEEVRGASRISLSVSEQDFAALSSQLNELGVRATSVSIDADPSLRSGDFRVVTDVGTLDARLGQRLDRLAEKLSESLRA